MIDFNLLKEILNNNNSFLLTTHVNPDADAIGSEVALYFILKELGKKVYIINHSITPYNLIFLDIDNKVEHYNEEKHSKLFNEVDVLVALDFNRSDRIVSMTENFIKSNKLKICIDHHHDAENFIDHIFNSAESSATGHIIYDFIKATNIVSLNYNIALNLYAAIMTDTGSFRFDRTTPEVHRIAAELIEVDVSPAEVFDKIYDQSLFTKIKLLGKALDSMKLYGEKKQIGYMIINREDLLATDALESDTDGFVNYSLSVENVRIGLLFLELKDGIKISFRSKEKIPVNKLAGEFGGGGHTNAAGLRIFNVKLSDYLTKILNKANEYLEKY